jgi:MFS family permease
MPTGTVPADSTAPGLGRDFWLFFAGQSVSNLGGSVTLFALPLLVYQLTGSALNLGATAAAGTLPYLLFGLVLGAWVDRLDRRRLMIATDLMQAATIAAIPVLAALDLLSVWAVYAVAFVGSTLQVANDAAQFAAIPSLVAADDLVAANGRIQASFSAATVAGPPLAGFLASRVPIPAILVVDAATFLISAGTLALVRRRFNVETGPDRPASTIRRDVAEGLRYVLGHPVLRAISAMMFLVNFVSTTVYTQLVLFAKERLGAGDGQLGLLYSAGSVGVVVLSLAAGPLRRRLPFGVVALGALVASGLTTIALAATTWFWLAVALQALLSGLYMLFNINTASLRQAIVPNRLLGRVMSVAMVLATAATPLGALLGGLAIERTGNVALVYAVIGGVTALIALGFAALSPLGHAERYLPDAAGADAAPPVDQSAPVQPIPGA